MIHHSFAGHKRRLFGEFARIRYLIRRDHRKDAEGRSKTPDRISRMVGVFHEIDRVTTLSERFDILNCNTADRPAILEMAAEIDGDRMPGETPCDLGMLSLITAFHADDSTLHRGKDCRDDFCPLHTVLMLHVIRTMNATREGREKMGELAADTGLFPAPAHVTLH
jgi:hypothetical protein